MRLLPTQNRRLLALMERENQNGGDPHKIMIQALDRKRRIDLNMRAGRPSSRPNNMKLASTP